MKKITILLCSILFLGSTGFEYLEHKKESFSEKTKRYDEITKTERFKELLSFVEVKSISEDERRELLEYLKVFENSTIDELRTVFDVEASADGSCYWVTVSTQCEHCRHSLFTCGPLTPYKPCSKYQLEYCGSYWSGKYRFQGYNVCC